VWDKTPCAQKATELARLREENERLRKENIELYAIAKALAGGE
jgi:hypothetical protein